MKKPIPLSLIYTNLDLNAFMLGESTVRLSSKFHLLITLFDKKYLVMFLVHRVLTSLHEYPFVPLLFSSSVKSSCSKTLLFLLSSLSQKRQSRVYVRAADRQCYSVKDGVCIHADKGKILMKAEILN